MSRDRHTPDHYLRGPLAARRAWDEQVEGAGAWLRNYPTWRLRTFMCITDPESLIPLHAVPARFLAVAAGRRLRHDLRDNNGREATPWFGASEELRQAVAAMPGSATSRIAVLRFETLDLEVAGRPPDRYLTLGNGLSLMPPGALTCAHRHFAVVDEQPVAAATEMLTAISGRKLPLTVAYCPPHAGPAPANRDHDRVFDVMEQLAGFVLQHGEQGTRPHVTVSATPAMRPAVTEAMSLINHVGQRHNRTGPRAPVSLLNYRDLAEYVTGSPPPMPSRSAAQHRGRQALWDESSALPARRPCPNPRKMS